MNLAINNIHTYYGNIEALKGVSLEINEGEIVTLIGANGAGKTTLIMSICGMTDVRNGSILYNSQDITGLKTYDIMKMGIALSPEGRRIFPHMSVFENLQMGALHSNPSYFNEDIDYVYQLFPILKERIKQSSGTLSGGEQQMLAIGRALMSRPKLLLLDEPSLGLAPLLVKQIFDAIVEVNKNHKTTIALVEQNAYQALNVSDRGYVLVNGTISMSGKSSDLIKDPAIKSAYLEGGK